MVGRENDYDRGFLSGVGSMLALVASGEVKRLDKSNILGYAKQVVEREKEKQNAPH